MKPKSILIVEDEVIVARNIERMLIHAGYHVIAVERNGLEALRIAREQHPGIILMDIKLEGELDGIDAGQQILDELFIPIIYITAHADKNTIQRATKTQPFGYLYKPINRNELVTAIEVALFKHEAEKRVRESEARFRGLVENSPTGILYVDREGTILDVNPRILEILGSPSEEATKKINFFSFPPLVESGVAEAFQKCIKKGVLSTHEHPYSSKWGKTSHLRYHLNPVRDPEGLVIGVQANIEDITDRVKAERGRELLSAASMSLLSLPRDKNLYEHISETIRSMIGESIVVTCSFNRETDKFRVNSVVGIKRVMGSVIKLLGRDPIGMEVAVSSDIRSLMEKVELARVQGDLHDQTVGGIGKTTARSMKRLLKLGETHVMGLVDQGELSGAIGIVLYKGTELHNKEIIETFINQATIAIKRFEAEEALRRSEENFRTLTTLSPVGIYATDAKGQCLYVNRRWSEITGISSDTALGDGWRQGLHPDDRDWMSLEWEELVKKGETWGREYRFLSEDGVTTWVYGLASPLKDEQGTITGFIGINLNITKRKETEIMLRESEDRFRTFFEGAPDAIILAKIDSGRIIDANKAALKLLERTHEEIITMHQNDLHPPEMSEFVRSAFHEDVQHIQIQDHSDPIETIILRKDGTRVPVEVIAKLIHLQGIPIIHGTFRDIVKRKESELERERLLAEIEEKQEELQRVIYVASHDLRSPLLNVRGFSEELGSAAGKIESLVREGRLPAEIMDELDEIIREDLHESVKYIGTSITKMESLIGGLLRISRIGTVQIIPVPIDMNSLLSEIRETFEFRLKEGSISLTIDDLPDCEGDPGQINQVFSNLIDNAIKYLDPDRRGEIEITGHPEGDGVVFLVRDNGIGIPEEHLKKIFDIFHRVGEGEISGEGLGLTAVKRILDRHDGRISLESLEGKGSTFNVFLPGTGPDEEA